MSPSDKDTIGGEKASQVQLLNVQQVHLQFYTLKIDVLQNTCSLVLTASTICYLLFVLLK